MPRKPKIVKDSDNLAIRFAGLQEGCGIDDVPLFFPADFRRIADGIRSLRAERDSFTKEIAALRKLRALVSGLPKNIVPLPVQAALSEAVRLKSPDDPE